MMVDEYLPGIMAVIDGGVEAVDAKSPSSYCAIAHFARIVEWRGQSFNNRADALRFYLNGGE
jgi:hypothetical protein